MKLAVLIQCHKNPEQINMLLEALQNERISVFLHVDKKSSITEQICAEKRNIHILPDSLRVNVQWGKFSQVEATINLMKFAQAHGPFDEYCLISGQDYPLVSADRLVEQIRIETNYVSLYDSKNINGKSNNYDKRTDIFYPKFMLEPTLFSRVLKRIYVQITGGYYRTFKVFRRKQIIGKMYFGSQWLCISNQFLDWMFKKLDDAPEYYRFFVNSPCPDESFFQTLFMASPYAGQRQEYLHYIKWAKGKNSPDNLTEKDFSVLVSSKKLFCRKIDGNYKLIELLKEHNNGKQS